MLGRGDVIRLIETAVGVHCSKILYLSVDSDVNKIQLYVKFHEWCCNLLEIQEAGRWGVFILILLRDFQ